MIRKEREKILKKDFVSFFGIFPEKKVPEVREV